MRKGFVMAHATQIKTQVQSGRHTQSQWQSQLCPAGFLAWSVCVPLLQPLVLLTVCLDGFVLSAPILSYLHPNLSYWRSYLFLIASKIVVLIMRARKILELFLYFQAKNRPNVILIIWPVFSLLFVGMWYSHFSVFILQHRVISVLLNNLCELPLLFDVNPCQRL